MGCNGQIFCSMLQNMLAQENACHGKKILKAVKSKHDVGRKYANASESKYHRTLFIHSVIIYFPVKVLNDHLKINYQSLPLKMI